MKRTPISNLEKFVEGLNKLLVVQPSAVISIEDNKFFVGDLNDSFLSEGIKNYLVNLGFKIESNRFVYTTKTKEEKTHGQRTDSGSYKRETELGGNTRKSRYSEYRENSRRSS